MRLRHGFVMALVLGVAACEAEPVETAAPAAPPSQAACEQVRLALESEARKTGMLFEDSGTAMIDQARWFRMSEASRTAIFESLALLARCGGDDPPPEVEVTIRNEAGAVIATRRVGF